MAANPDIAARADGSGAFAPLREVPFRRIWLASLFSNFSQLFLGVGAAWEMTRLTSSPSMIALVQTAMMLPLMLVTLPAGAIADMFDRRRIAMTGLAFAAVSAAGLTAFAYYGLTTPWLLLGFCVLIGAGVALFSPSWQASIPEQVSRANLPAAVALGTISFNVARSIGPALGGLIVLAAGAKAVFGLTSILYMPLLIAFFVWNRQHVPSRLPPERIDRAIVGGARYGLHSTPIRGAVFRILVFGLTTATATALAPLVAKNILGGDAAIFGILLGAGGVGAVLGAFFVSSIRERFSTELSVRVCAFGTGGSLIAIGLSTSLAITCAAFFAIGVFNILTIALLNVSVQMAAPRWVTARVLSLFSSAITMGVGIGAWGWGVFAGVQSVEIAYIASGIATMATVLVGLFLPLSRDQEGEIDSVEIPNEVNVALPLTLRSGPVVIEVEYEVDPDKARDFYGVMMRLSRMRKRLGGFEWSLSRDISDPKVWIERYNTPNWGDYLRMRDRYTQADIDLQAEASAYNMAGGEARVRRSLARPFGSVRYKSDSPDPQQETVNWF